MIKTGLVGLGGISALHLQALSKMDFVKITALCDVDIDKARARAAGFGIQNARFFADFDEMMAAGDFDVLHVMTPHHLHAKMAVSGLRAGKNVLLEKPMDVSLDEVRKLICAGDGRRLGVVYQNRYNAATQAVKAAIESGEYGKLLGLRAMVAWNRDEAYYGSAPWRGRWDTEGGGVLINQAIHTMDLLYYLGGPFRRIKGGISLDKLKNIIEVEDNAHAVIEYVDGKTALFYASNNNVSDEAVEIHFSFEKGALRMIGNNLYRFDGEIVPISVSDATATLGKAVYGNGHEVLIRDFYECIEKKRPFSIDAKEGYPSIWAVLSIYESTRTDNWVEFR